MYKIARFGVPTPGAHAVAILVYSGVKPWQIAVLQVVLDCLRRKNVAMNVVMHRVSYMRGEDLGPFFTTLFDRERIPGNPVIVSWCGMEIAYSDCQYPTGLNEQVVLDDEAVSEIDAIRRAYKATAIVEVFGGQDGVLDEIASYCTAVVDSIDASMAQRMGAKDTTDSIPSLQTLSLRETLETIWRMQRRFPPVKKE